MTAPPHDAGGASLLEFLAVVTIDVQCRNMLDNADLFGEGPEVISTALPIPRGSLLAFFTTIATDPLLDATKCTC